jgi:hypothetical protein
MNSLSRVNAEEISRARITTKLAQSVTLQLLSVRAAMI